MEFPLFGTPRSHQVFPERSLNASTLTKGNNPMDRNEEGGEVVPEGIRGVRKEGNRPGFGGERKQNHRGSGKNKEGAAKAIRVQASVKMKRLRMRERRESGAKRWEKSVWGRKGGKIQRKAKKGSENTGNQCRVKNEDGRGTGLQTKK